MKPSLRQHLFSFFFLSLLFVLSSLTASSQTVQAIQVDEESPMGKDFYRVFFIGDHVVYESQTHFSKSESRLHFDSASGEMTSTDTLLSSGAQSNYFVYHRDSLYGYRYEPWNLLHQQRLLVSKAKENTFGTNGFDGFLKFKPDSSLLNSNGTSLREVYRFAAHPDTPAYRIVFTYDKNLAHLQHSLNPILDSAKQMKLQKLELYILEFRPRGSQITYPGTAMITEMKELPATIPEEVLFYLNWYKDVEQKRK